ncbi:MAG TPA: NUDIX hydrolase [Streptosporangiaceae bacterium]|nr:NUDIX hydrolase [Streptosporangiaceae bacterium]
MSGSTGETGAATGYPVPRVPASAGALIFDRLGRLLILKPTYKSGWTIPGGVMEAGGETPWQACQREVREECGLEIGSGRLVCTDFRMPTHRSPGGIRFLFDCGALRDSAFDAVELQAEEIAEHRLLPLADALPLLRKPIRRRITAVRKRNGSPRKHAIVYLENGRPPLRRTH